MPALRLIFALFAIRAHAQQTPQPEPQAQPFTVSMETTYRPEITSSGTVEYSPIPLTPDLGQIAKSIAEQPSVAAAMRQAKNDGGFESTREEL
ncbi:hypothetical protein H4R20_004297 [Coemansia guatemalensis]|uniref:Uncharacterized protein n=1 Tax=Coemansia guatemalensis TaxID=2761395 RepID=A0A9W8LT89_9FUNG|nr:hypothetical protein H4R20_004297 [Coemansia guatemalensis]